MTKHSGYLLAEILISIPIFTIGLLALMGAITFSLSSIMKSREAVGSDMEITNLTEADAMLLTISPDAAVSLLSGQYNGKAEAILVPASSDTAATPLTLRCELYIYEYESGKRRGTAFYLLKKED
ncbi:MAG: hypothetical protein Q4D58_09230 [Synergistaceae bacterium]|nr:hypothetical protein [Synergistaceae bacterium]